MSQLLNAVLFVYTGTLVVVISSDGVSVAMAEVGGRLARLEPCGKVATASPWARYPTQYNLIWHCLITNTS